MGSESSTDQPKLFPPGFRFHPTDEELILYYLKRKLCGRSLKLDIIADLDVYKWDPHDLPGQSKWKTGDRQWFFFSPRDRRYPFGGRSNRATVNGYWKATGKDRIINCNSRSVGIKKTIVYYQGRAPSGQRTDWVMHEYVLHKEELKRCRCTQPCYVLYKLFKKSGPGPKNGEQYGAPFVEEEWVNDDEYLDVEPLLVRNINALVNEPKQLTVGVDIVPPMTQINPVDVEDVDRQIYIGPNHKPLEVQSGPDMPKSVNEPSVNTYVEGVNPLVVNEDFLEMDDLIGPQPLQFADFGGFCDYALYGSTSVNETIPYESQQIQKPYYATNLQYGMGTSGYNLWSHDQSNYNFVAAQATEEFMESQAGEITTSAPSGVTSDDPGKPDSHVNHCQDIGEDDGSDSWFSSALWAFVESVPTNPALAVESDAFLSKEFSRMSNIYADSHGGVERTSVARRGGRSSRPKGSRVIVYFCVGVVFALMYVFLGTCGNV
uniref:NAC domain-containing protein 17-like n=1 Tax=Erigeron canadensis TaxID=72917 RepID=UPI001CB99048|nr:NAC domain-containing protein 17-like [Erigeron canadensis]